MTDYSDLAKKQKLETKQIKLLQRKADALDELLSKPRAVIIERGGRILLYDVDTYMSMRSNDILPVICTKETFVEAIEALEEK